MAVTQIDLIKRGNGSGANTRMYAKSNGSGLWVPADPLASPLFVDLSDPTKQVQFTLNNIPTSTTFTAPWDTKGMADDALSYQEITTTATGTQDDFNIASGIGNVTFIRCNNASLLSWGGFTGGKAGKWLHLHSIGAGAVDIINLSGGSSAGNLISTGISSTIHLAAGSASYAILRYEAATGYWQVLNWEQGIALAYTPSWTCVGTAPALGNGTLTGAYYRKGQNIFFYVSLTYGTTTTSGTGAFNFTTPTNISSHYMVGNANATEPGTAVFGIPSLLVASANTVQLMQASGTKVQGTSPFTFANTHNLEVYGWYVSA